MLGMGVMEPIQIRPQIDPQKLTASEEGISSRYSKARNGAVSREAQARGGRSEEIQAERRNEARSKGSKQERSTRRGRRHGKRGARGKAKAGSNPQIGDKLVQARSAEPENFSSKLEQKTAKKTGASGASEQLKGAGKAPEREATALMGAITLTSAGQPTAAIASKGAGALAKTGGVTQRGAELTTGAEVRAKGEETGKKPALSKAREAAPTPEREQASDVLKQVRLQLSPETRSATVNLKPAELGRVSIRIVVDGDQVQAFVRAESPEALAALEQYMPELQAALGDHGFQEADIDLSLGFEGEERESAEDLRAEELAPTKIHRLFQSTEAVDYFA
jgi:hypothetical protein